MFKTKVHFFYTLLCAVLVLLYVPMLWKLCVFAVQNPLTLIPFSLGITGYVIFTLLLRRFTRSRMMWSTFEHELTHALLCLLTLTPVHSLQAANKADEKRGFLGCVFHEGTGPARGILIGLAPYFVPTYTLLLMLFMPFLHEEALPIFKGVLGFSFGYHLLSTWKETGSYQSDLQKQGLRFSYVFIIATNLVMIPFVIVVGIVDLHSGLEYLAEGAKNILFPYELFTRIK
jgi:hypothetical protein